MNPYEAFEAAYEPPVKLVWVQEPDGKVHLECVTLGLSGALPWLVQGTLPDGRLWWSAAKEFG